MRSELFPRQTLFPDVEWFFDILPSRNDIDGEVGPPPKVLVGIIGVGRECIDVFPHPVMNAWYLDGLQHGEPVLRCADSRRYVYHEERHPSPPSASSLCLLHPDDVKRPYQAIIINPGHLYFKRIVILQADPVPDKPGKWYGSLATGGNKDTYVFRSEELALVGRLA